MSGLRLPLAVRVESQRGGATITRRLRDLRFRSTAPRGYASIQMSLHQPLTGQPDWAQYYAHCYVYDTRSGKVLCEGRLEDPGRSAGPDGQVWDLVAIGPASHTQDRSPAWLYVDRRMSDDAWQQADLVINQDKGQVSRGAGTGDADTVRLQWDVGQALTQSRVLTIRYVGMLDTGQWIARVSASHVEGVTSSDLAVQAISRFIGVTGSATILEADTWSTTAGSILVRRGTEYSTSPNAVDIRIQKTTATAITTNANHWCNVTDPIVIGSRYRRNGTEITSGYGATVLAHQVVEDLLGRLLPGYAADTAEVDDTASHPIDQLIYPDGASAADILDDLMLLEPNYLWEALASGPDGRYRFRWRPWPTQVRYEADVLDGYEGPGSMAELYDAVTVRWRGRSGRIRTVRVTQDTPALTAIGLTREPRPIDLGDNIGSSSAAVRIGTQFLREHRWPPNRGRLRVSRPIMDMDTGAAVAPWEIESGYLIRVRGVRPSPDALNASGRDGVTVFRVVSVEFRASDATAVLELDSYAASTSRALATLLARANTRRR